VSMGDAPSNPSPVRPSWLLALPPLALAALEIWHPVIRSGTAAGLEPLVSHAHAWTIVHLAQLALFGLTALAVAGLLAEIRSRLAAVVRAALGVFTVVYSAFDTFAGLATVTVIQASQALLPPALPVGVELANAIFMSPINAALFLVGTASWFLGAGLTGIALLKAGASRVPSLLLLLAALALWGDHTPPFGPVTFGLTAASILWLALSGRARTGPA
jgi:hypothetical protein